VVVEPFDTEVSPITTAALGSRLASPCSMDAWSDGIFSVVAATAATATAATIPVPTHWLRRKATD
jgi:hypothetical protein